MNKDECVGRTQPPARAFARQMLLTAVLTGIMVGGCGGDSVSPGVPASSQTAGMQGSARAPQGLPPGAPAAERAPPPPQVAANTSGDPSPLEAARLARMKALPLLSALSDGDKLGLLRRLPEASPLQRLRALDAYPKLEELADRQREILLRQLEDIVPVTTPAKGFVCECGNGVVHKMCVRESCQDRSVAGAVCYQACGRLPMLTAACSATPECARGR